MLRQKLMGKGDQESEDITRKGLGKPAEAEVGEVISFKQVLLALSVFLKSG